MPDAKGKLKGIVVPELPWKRLGDKKQAESKIHDDLKRQIVENRRWAGTD